MGTRERRRPRGPRESEEKDPEKKSREVAKKIETRRQEGRKGPTDSPRTEPTDSPKKRPVRESQSQAAKRRLEERRREQATESGDEKRAPDEKEVKVPEEKEERTEKKGKKKRLGPEVDASRPEVRGVPIESKEQLYDLVDNEYAGLKSKKDFEKRLKEAEKHLELLDKYRDKSHLEYGELTRSAKEIGVDPQTLSNWMTKGMTPRLYTYMEWATPRSEAEAEVKQIRESNNGVDSMKDLQARLDNYYFAKEERESHFYRRELKKAEKYFDFLDRYEQGGNHLDIAKEVGLSETGARGYLSGGRPWLVRIASQIPAEIPEPKHKWLPLTAGTNAYRDDWIQAPEEITDYTQVLNTLEKIKPLDTEAMKRWDNLYRGDYTDEQRFMHLLGFIASDGKVPSSSTSSLALGINLTTGKDWSYRYGEATCYHLGRIGVSAHQLDDIKEITSVIDTPNGPREIRSESQFHWTSKNSPLLRWVWRSCLGYDDSAKTYQSIDGGWIQNAPSELRSSFLQGLSDGDGSASSRGSYFSISTHSNHDFVEELLGSFDVETSRSETFVRTKNIEALRKVAEIPPFKYADTRTAELKKAVEMLDATRRNIRSEPPTVSELEFMSDLRSEGLSFSAIRERLYDKYGYTLDPRDVRKLILRFRKKKK